MTASPTAIYRAWTQGFDTWFASPGTLAMRAAVGEPFYFDVAYDGQHHPHYGRFVDLIPDHVVELAWVTGQGGTDGAETHVRVELSPDPQWHALTPRPHRLLHRDRRPRRGRVVATGLGSPGRGPESFTSGLIKCLDQHRCTLTPSSPGQARGRCAGTTG